MGFLILKTSGVRAEEEEGKYFDREINTEPHAPKESDASLQEVKATGPFSDPQKVWVTGCTQTKGLFQ